jgi:DNA polymerase-3 subunit epsilon
VSGLADFVTLDLETTGLSPRIDRIVEVGLVRTSPSGRVVEEFTTLINPERDIGPTFIHGIHAGEVAVAPKFSEVAASIAEIINGCIVVAHNAAFDRRFLEAELVRAGRSFESFDVLCTLELMRLLFERGPRRLADCCTQLGIQLGSAHHALDDARMTSRLLHELSDRFRPPFDLKPAWIDPNPPSTRPAVLRGENSPREREATYLQGLVEKLPERDDLDFISASGVFEYLNLLDRVLEDRKISDVEARALTDFAVELGLTQSSVKALHASYLANLCGVARQDEVVTESELRDIATVATLLRVEEWEGLLESPGPASPVRQVTQGLTPGQSVCFTGGREAEKAEMKALAVERGLVVKSSVSKALSLLVVADADSQSGKATKARQYGTRIVTAAVFRGMLAQMLPGA